MPATRTERTTPPAEPPATGILLAAAAVCETHGTQHLAERLDNLRDELGEINVGSPRAAQEQPKKGGLQEWLGESGQ